MAIKIDDIELIVVNETYDISGWDDIDPEENRAGHFYSPEGKKIDISLNDPEAIYLADKQMTDGVFQFDTPLAKCCAFDTPVLTRSGWKHICDLNPFADEIAYWEDHQIRYTGRFKLIKTGVDKVVKITTDDGRQLRLTPEHRVLTKDGWKQAKDLKTGDELVAPVDYHGDDPDTA